MKRHIAGNTSDETETPQTRSWAEQLSHWFRHPVDRDHPRPAAPMPATTAPALLPLSEQEIESLKTAYLQRLYPKCNVFHLYGLDPHSRALQESGQALELKAIYTPLNTTLRVPANRPSSGCRSSPDEASKGEQGSIPALQAVGQEGRAIIRGPLGSGKSTLLRFLALSLAERLLGAPTTDPVGQPAGMSGPEPRWTSDFLFPVWIDLRAFASSPHDRSTAEGLCAYIASELYMLPGQLITQLIEVGGLIFLLDGLGNALEATTGFVQRFAHTPNQFLVTSQPFIELESAPLKSLAEITLGPWTLDQLDGFCGRWYAELERKGWVDDEAARDLPGDLRTALRRDYVRALAQRPSLMTLIALLHTVKGELADSRVKFYHQLIELGFTTWTEGKNAQERDLRQAFDLEALRTAVAEATYHRLARLELVNGRAGAALVEFSASDLRALLIHVCRDGRLEGVDTLVTRMLTRPSLLEECAPETYVYAHPSLQVHAAAGHLATQPDLPHLAVSLAKEDPRWHEVILLAGCRLAQTETDRPTAISLVDALCPHPPPTITHEIPDANWRLARLAGELLVEIGQMVAGQDLTRMIASDRGDSQESGTLGRVKGWLAALVERGMLAPLERAQAGSVLDRLQNGDPRPGVSQPEPVWCPVPAGSFWQGDGQAAQTVQVDPFWISRYPTTNAQYATFVQATGHSPPSHWQGNRPPAGKRNHPVVCVSWQDANDYCSWYAKHLIIGRTRIWRGGQISEHTRATNEVSPNWVIRLPLSIEWEKAARGGLEIPAPSNSLSPGDALTIDNPLPRRVYPWGDDWQLSSPTVKGGETRCNVSESGIGTTTPVGMYPDSASPYGVLDMAGNVWEWCLDWADEEHRYKIRRGGAFRYTHEHARCATYDQAHPSLGWPHLGFRIVLAPARG